ncbi:MAG: RpiB/LacA/LacB family sugar-phosphate isomerase [Bacteroidales bacterium]|nr:RpiB/LacA/LacB family sugar-phosphate isomerase [Bacteroidales bacterium]MCL2133402.1 RpiB/LacA/LacB family sugar-phosphate isomerase [Bacteroidales bacterium]
MRKIGIAADHAGFEQKELLKACLQEQDIEVKDFGTYSIESMDYPDVAHPLAVAVEKGEVAAGIALCGSGQGMAMTLNKHVGIRAALCWLPAIARIARNHNDANICVLPARFIDEATAIAIVQQFLAAPFDGGRHEQRIEKMAQGKG